MSSGVTVADVEYEYRFLADRFVEGTCPRCGYDVGYDWRKPGQPLGADLVHHLRTHAAINATIALEHSPLPPSSSTLDANAMRNIVSQSNNLRTHVFVSTLFNPDLKSGCRWRE
jgi:hypothetical protein